MAGCGKRIEITVSTRFSAKTIPFTCGHTGPTGYPEFCAECAPKYAGRDWRRFFMRHPELYSHAGCHSARSHVRVAPWKLDEYFDALLPIKDQQIKDCLPTHIWNNLRKTASI